MATAGDSLEDPSVRWGPDGPGGVPSFAKHVIPLFNQSGCSARECHGAFQGQAGFRLSLFGYDLKLDHAELTSDKEGDAPRPRIDFNDPDASLALRKPLEDGMDHEGGRKLKSGTWQHRLLREWVAAGAPFDPAKEPYLDKLELLPADLHLAGAARFLRSCSVD